MPVFGLFPYMLSGVALGIAEGLIDDFAAGSSGRGRMTGAKIAAVPSVQLRLGEAAAFARASRLFQETNCREAQALIERGEVPDMRAKARYRLEGAYAVDWAVRAVDTMFTLSGASGLYESGHVARAFRDAHAVKQHFSFNTDVAGTTYGRVALGLPSDNPTL
jgi:3-hydroxy-9,10-secoandrosta-1,3,5(10)-triene-9,17-dione monooxygenase